MPGPAPARSEERRRRNAPKNEILKVKPDSHLPFKVDFAPEPPEASEDWHPYVIDLYESLKADPSRLWTGPTAWAANFVMCENLSRLLNPRVAGIIQASEFGEAEVVREEIPLNGSELAGVLKWLSMVGVYEENRLRIAKEITFHAPPEQAAVVDADAITATRLGLIQGGQAG